RADGRMESADFEVVRVSGVRAVKLVSTAAPEDVDQLRSIQPEMFILVRLFADLRFRRVTADEFADWAISDAQPFYARGVKCFEIHNEPNLVAEGWGQSWQNGGEFSDWFLRVYARLKAAYPDAQLGYPGLSPGPQLNGIRLAEDDFRRESEAALR